MPAGGCADRDFLNWIFLGRFDDFGLAATTGKGVLLYGERNPEVGNEDELGKIRGYRRCFWRIRGGDEGGLAWGGFRGGLWRRAGSERIFLDRKSVV